MLSEVTTHDLDSLTRDFQRKQVETSHPGMPSHPNIPIHRLEERARDPDYNEYCESLHDGITLQQTKEKYVRETGQKRPADRLPEDIPSYNNKPKLKTGAFVSVMGDKRTYERYREINQEVNARGRAVRAYAMNMHEIDVPSNRNKERFQSGPKIWREAQRLAKEQELRGEREGNLDHLKYEDIVKATDVPYRRQLNQGAQEAQPPSDPFIPYQP
jgi:hypothetical protein